MSSIPQGWHGTVGPTKAPTSCTTTSSSVPVTIRKKWNSPLSNVPQTKLPSYKSSNLRLKKTCDLNNTYQIKPAVASCSTTETKPPSTPAKLSAVKEYQNEIAKLKKEVATFKAENSILKAKVRRVDDENLQKGRQIEKMRAEIVTLQKNETTATNRRSKESQELLSLRQKCLRLENAIKDKENTIKKLTSESSKREEQTNMKTTLMQKQIRSSSPGHSNKTGASKSSERESLSVKPSQPRTSLSSKPEVTKLRDMIHKLEKENKELQQQTKLQSQEIRRLKVQLKNKDRLSLPNSALPRANNELVKNTKNPAVLPTCNGEISNSSVTPTSSSALKKQRSPFLSSISINSSTDGKQQPVSHKTRHSTPDPNIGKVTKVPNGTISRQPLPKKQTKDGSSKLPSRTPVSTPSIKRPIVKTSKSKLNTTITLESPNIEQKVQEMRENIAAKKIQRSWREHQKSLNHTSEPGLQSVDKALTFIVSSLKHHKSRKDKLKILAKRKNVPNNFQETMIKNIVQDTQSRIWKQELSDSLDSL